jgi:hypothetical protein
VVNGSLGGPVRPVPHGLARCHGILCYALRVSAGSLPNPGNPRHGAVVRATHWITVIAFLALLISGAEIVISHPRFYWGEVGNALTRPLFTLPIPASRSTVPTGYGYVLPDQNGWSRPGRMGWGGDRPCLRDLQSMDRPLPETPVPSEDRR